jgi:sugar O-acyltransferase (sialic acid O-acetyltransferase NeuD family)
MSRIIIVGAGGQGAIVADIAHDVIGFVDDDPKFAGTTCFDRPVLGPIASLATIEHDAVVVAIGDNRIRRTLIERLCAAGERLATIVHPFASVAPSATIGVGSMLSAGALVLPRAVLGRGVILNTKASVDHDSVVGDVAHVAPGATVGANVRIGEEAFIGLGASVVSGITIGARTTIGAGAVVVHDLPDDVTAVGVPARITSDRRRAGAVR